MKRKRRMKSGNSCNHTPHDITLDQSEFMLLKLTVDLQVSKHLRYLKKVQAKYKVLTFVSFNFNTDWMKLAHLILSQ